jgi:hypothetical protein
MKEEVGEATQAIRDKMWRDCHDALQTAFSTASVPALFPHASGSWDVLGINFLRETYQIQDLGQLSPSASSVMLVESDEAKPPDDVVHKGAVFPIHNTDEDLYMKDIVDAEGRRR